MPSLSVVGVSSSSGGFNEDKKRDRSLVMPNVCGTGRAIFFDAFCAFTCTNEMQIDTDTYKRNTKIMKNEK
jgi:hypothetical protein